MQRGFHTRGFLQSDFPTRRKDKEDATWETIWVNENGSSINLDANEAVPDRVSEEVYAEKVIIKTFCLWPHP
jgi:hypothetical protein